MSAETKNEKETSEITSSENSSKKKHNRKYDLILLGVLALIGIGIFLFYQSKESNRDSEEAVYYVQVDVNNRAEALIPLSQDGDYTFNNIYSDGENVVHIENGGVSMHSATCPDQVCVYQGIIEPPTVIPIVCMPNVVYVSLVERNEIDWSLIRESIVPEELKADYEAYQESIAAK